MKEYPEKLEDSSVEGQDIKQEGKQDFPAGPSVVAVCGLKNSGKTTLIVSLVKQLTASGLRVAVIKHDGHDFSCDIPGTDSWQFSQAGAYGTAVYSADRMFVHRQGTGETFEDLLQQFPEADLILLEGGKDSSLPKIEVVRSEISACPVSNPKGRFLIVTDWPEGTFSEPALPFGDVDKIAERIVISRAERTARDAHCQTREKSGSGRKTE